MDTIKRQPRFTKHAPSIQHIWDSASGSWIRYEIYLDDLILARQALQALKNKSRKSIRGPVKVELVKVSES